MEFIVKNRDRVKQAHGGIGASSHMACLLFNARADARKFARIALGQPVRMMT